MGQWKWSKVAVVAALAAGGILLGIFALRSVTAEPESIGLVRWVACGSCGYSAKAAPRERPAVCPKCRQKSVWPAMRCSACRAVVAIDTFRFDAEKREPYCPRCGAASLVPMDGAAAGAEALPPRR